MNPILALIVANIIWGAASPIFKLSLGNIPPFTLAYIRFFFAGLIFLPLVFRHWQNITVGQFFKIVLIGFFGVTINISFFFLGLQRTESINVPVIASSGPVFLYLLSIIFLKEKPKLRIFFGMLTALAGVLLIILSPIFTNGVALDLTEIEGNLFILIATMGSVIQTLLSKDTLKKVNPYLVSAVSFLFGAVTFIPFMKGELAQWSFSQLNMDGIIGIVFGVFFSSAIAYYLYYYGVSKIKAQEVGIFTYIDPVVAVIIAMPLLHEYPNLFYVIGTVLVFGGIYLAERRFNYHPIHKLKHGGMVK